MNFPTSVKIVEVGPRDGLQNEKQIIPTDIKIEFINLLSETGLSSIEVTSFVSPKKIPQMADNYEVFTQIKKKDRVEYSALVPNIIGFDQALQAEAKMIAVFCATTETFSKKNINCSIKESLERYQAVIEKAKENAIKVRGYVSCALGCPYEGDVNPKDVATLANELYQMGCYEISLGDTIGVGTVPKVQRLLDAVKQLVPPENIAVHFHDTYGQALINIYTALQQEITIIDSSVAGLGGCPFAKGASGNVASEDVVYMLQGLNINTGIDLVKLCQAGLFISKHLHRSTLSKVALALAAKGSACDFLI